MVRLIDADALIAKHGKWYTEEGTEEGFIGTLKSLIDEQPTIEAEPVKHGRWIKDESTYAGPGLDNLQCSECKRNAVTWRRDIPLSRMYRYCPNCGAKMDGGEDEN